MKTVTTVKTLHSPVKGVALSSYQPPKKTRSGVRVGVK